MNAESITMSLKTNFCVLGERYEHQQALLIQIAAMTLASNSEKTIAQYRSSKSGSWDGVVVGRCGPQCE